MQSIRITSRPHSRIRKWNQFSQFRWTPSIITKSQSIISIVLQVYLAIKVTQWHFADLISFIVPSPVKKLVTNSMNMFLKVLLAKFLLFCFMFKKEQFWNKENCLFHFESFFSSWDNKILNFQAFMSWHHQVSKHETQNLFYWITWEVNTLYQWNLVSLWNFYYILWNIWPGN